MSISHGMEPIFVRQPQWQCSLPAVVHQASQAMVCALVIAARVPCAVGLDRTRSIQRLSGSRARAPSRPGPSFAVSGGGRVLQSGRGAGPA